MLEKIADKIKEGGPAYVSGMWGSSFSFFASRLFPLLGKNLLVVLEDEKRAQDFYSDLNFFLKDASVRFYPEWETFPYDTKPPLEQYQVMRLKALSACLKPEPCVIVTSLNNLFLPNMDASLFREKSFLLEPGQKIGYSDFEVKLAETGYERNFRVMIPGDFSVRGEVIDLFSPAHDHPVRIGLAGDTIEDLRFFDPAAQKSLEKAGSALVVPARELLLDPLSVRNFTRAIGRVMEENAKNRDDPQRIWSKVIFEEEGLKALKENAEQGSGFSESYNYFPLFQNKKETLVDFFSGSGVVLMLPSQDAILNGYRKIFTAYQEAYKKRLDAAHYYPAPEQYLTGLETLLERLSPCPAAFYSIIPFNRPDEFQSRVSSVGEFYGHTEKFKSYLESRKEYAVTALALDQPRLAHLKELWQKGGIAHPVRFLEGRISRGFDAELFKEIYIQDFEFFGKSPVSTGRSLQSRILTEELETVSDLKTGDLVVHLENGIGIYRGMKRIETEGNVKDYFIIEYAAKTRLYLPLEKIRMLHKYIGDEDEPPPLSRLGTDEFSKTKKRVERSIVGITKDLIRTYALREKIRGYSFPPDSEWQKQFENAFPFVETPDQLTSAREIKSDMEKPKPMDRLLCGDVGFGKTEVAMRAVFKTVMNGKQAAVLVPTTILAEQHYLTFTKRMAGYPLKIEMLSRFKPPAEQKRIIREVNEGKVDIIIGTHRLISPDVRFRDIGLVVVDEEQRFGVLHKEKLKVIKAVVDVLTMSATPIPRTLYLSLSGIRDISVLDTPPEGRTPIETRVERFSETVLRNAMLFELERGGQVFFIHNRINTIDAMARFIRKTVPEARVKVIHGRMENDRLEMTMLEFVEKEFDVLVTTTIIESGIDMPNVNTIIINRADAFGLSQLYQLRGRVGRSTTRAFAYLLYPGDRSITEKAEKRLLTIYEYSDLGAGYKIALRDLEIRGAGNIFGPQQHGNILAVGLELYGKILSGMIRKMKGEELPEEFEPALDFEYRAFIPDALAGERVKIEIYKELNKCGDFSSLDRLKEDFRDRFGASFLEGIAGVLAVQEIKIILKRLGIASVRQVEKKKFETVLEVSFGEITPGIREKIREKLPVFRVKNNLLYLSLDKENLVEEMKKNLILLI